MKIEKVTIFLYASIVLAIIGLTGLLIWSASKPNFQSEQNNQSKSDSLPEQMANTPKIDTSVLGYYGFSEAPKDAEIIELKGSFLKNTIYVINRPREESYFSCYTLYDYNYTPYKSYYVSKLEIKVRYNNITLYTDNLELNQRIVSAKYYLIKKNSGDEIYIAMIKNSNSKMIISIKNESELSCEIHYGNYVISPSEMCSHDYDKNAPNYAEFFGLPKDE